MQKEIQGHTAAIKGVSWGAMGKYFSCKHRNKP